jgi:hypothetical protein
MLKQNIFARFKCLNGKLLLEAADLDADIVNDIGRKRKAETRTKFRVF